MGFFVRKSKTHPYRLIEEVWTPERKERVVPREGYAALGFNPAWTLEEAKKHARLKNKQSQLEQRKIANTARRIALEKEIDEVYLPPDLVAGFERELGDTYQDNPERLNNVMKQWSVVKQMISRLALDPKDFFDEKIKFQNYFRNPGEDKHPWSPDYIKKLTWVVNQWGHFVSRKRNTHYRPLPKLSSVQIQKLHDVRENIPGIKRPAEPLTYRELQDSKHKFEDEGLLLKWNWMFIGLVFGLRPKEVDGLKNPKNWKLEWDPSHKVHILLVYQSKLTNLPKDKRWKMIPVYTNDQKKAVELIKENDFEAPLNKTLARLIGDGIEKYSPRKGFTDLMLELGFSLEDISLFLGHNSIEMTWRHYKNKRRFNLPGKTG